MADPIASSALTVVVEDTDHVIHMNVAKDPDGTGTLDVHLSLAVRTSKGNVIDRLDGKFNLTQAAQAAIVDPLDVAALRRVLVALGQKLASDAGMTVA